LKNGVDYDKLFHEPYYLSSYKFNENYMAFSAYMEYVGAHSERGERDVL
jgi:hypothetical protein